MSLFNVAIVGAGIGREHLAAYQQLPQLFNVSTVCDTDESRAAEIIGDSNTIQVTTSLDSVLSNDSIDIVDVCLPPHLHKSVSIDALKAGKHVVCEKPLVSSLKDADDLYERLQRSGKTLTPVFQYRYGPGLAQLRALIEAGLCGKPLVANIETHWHRDAQYYDNPWRGTWKGEQGGCVLGHAIHNHDLLCSVFGPIKQLSAFTNTRVNDIETEDCASIAFLLQNGATATSSITLGAADDTSRLRFCFEQLTATSGLNPYAPADGTWNFQARGETQQQDIDDCLAELADEPVGYVGLFTELAKKLKGVSHQCVNYADGRQSLEIVTAVYHANDTQTVVTLPLKTSHEKYASWVPAS